MSFKVGDEVRLLAHGAIGKVNCVEGNIVWVRVNEEGGYIPIDIYMITKTKAQRQKDSAEAVARKSEEIHAEFERRQALPTIDDKLRVIGETIITLCEKGGDRGSISIAYELAHFLSQETRE